MTGYAQLDFLVEGRQFKLQAKSVNHRFFEFRMRAPREWQMLENEIRSLCKEELQRGSLDFWIEEAKTPIYGKESGASEDFAKARAFVLKLGQVLKATEAEWQGTGIANSERAQFLARHSDNWNAESVSRDSSELPLDAEAFAVHVRSVCSRLMDQRRKEGEETRLSVVEHGQYIRKQWAEICRELPLLKDAWRKNLEDRLQKLAESFTGGSLDPQRIYQEFVLLADKRDVSEEVQRIDAHLKSLDALTTFPRESAIGKRLDFVCQELNREWTTLSNKIQDAALNQIVGEAKLTIEKIREQSLNLV